MFQKVALLILLAVPFAAARQDFEETHSEIHPLAPGSTLHIHWTVGDLHIAKGEDSHNIHIRYTVHTDRESNLQKVRVGFREQGSVTTIESDSPYRGNTSIDADIEIPNPLDLDVHLGVGDVRVEGIEGNKTLDVRVGDIHVADGNATDYRLVRARTRIGDVDWNPREWQANGLTNESGWLGHKLTYRSNGKYELRAEVSVGDIDLR